MNHNEQTLKEVLLQLINTPELHDKYILTSLREKWKHILGPTIAGHTSDLRFRGGVLSIVVTSAPLRHELTLGKEKLLQVLNEALGTDAIKSIHLY